MLEAKRNTIQRRVYDQMSDFLIMGELLPGQRITNRKMAAAMNVSVTPVREALQRLATEGALHTLPNGSLIVPLVEQEQVEELRKITIALEGMAMEIATPLLTPSVLIAVDRTYDELSRGFAKNDLKTILAKNYELRTCLLPLTRSDFLQDMIRRMWLIKGPHYARFLQAHVRRYHGKTFHRLFDCLKSGDLVGVKENYIHIIETEFDTWIEFLNSNAGATQIAVEPVKARLVNY